MGNKVAKNPGWKPDSAAARCEICDVEFSLFTRRHHCRNCGGIFCDTCTKDRAFIPLKRAVSSPVAGRTSSPRSGSGTGQPDRVCGVCYLKLEVSGAAAATSSSGAPLTPGGGLGTQQGSGGGTRNSQGVPVNRRRGSDVGINRLTVAQSSQPLSAPQARAL